MTSMASTGVHAEVSGPVSGQLAVGSNIVQYHVEAGGVVHHADPAATARPKRLAKVAIKGRDPDLVGRSDEVQSALAALSPARPVQLHGVAGVGKSVLLKHIGHHPPSGLGAAVVYQECGVETLDETLQFLFEAFYETPPEYKPTDGELRRLLAEVTGLVALDDVNFARTELDALLDALPQATFLLASERRRLWGQGRAIAVRGLEDAEAVALLERSLGRPLAEDERTAAADACRAVEGHPLRIEQLASVVEELGETVAGALPAGGDGKPVDALVDRLKSRLGPEQLEVLGALAAVLGASLSAEHLAAVVGCEDIATVVEPLLRSGLVQSHSPRYSLREPRAAAGDTAEWTRRVADHLADAAETDADPQPVAAESGAILTVLRQLRDDGDDRAVLRLSRATERPLMLGRRWGAWRLVLEEQLSASRALGDRGSEAWALHQLGTRALCLGDEAAARADLGEALAIREDLGDRTGAAATRHNLGLLGPPPPPPPPTRPSPPPPAPPPAAPAWAPPRPPAAAAPSPTGSDRRRPVGLWWAVAAVAVLLLSSLAAVTLVSSDSGPAEDDPAVRTTTVVPGAGAPPMPPAVVAGGITVEPGGLRFDDQPVGTASPRRALTMLNGRSSAVRPGGATVEGPGRDSFSVVASSCTGVSVPPGGRCTVEVVFHPPDAGDRAATLRLGVGDGPAVALAGRGVESAPNAVGPGPAPAPAAPGGGPVVAPGKTPQTTTTTTSSGLVAVPVLVAPDTDLVITASPSCGVEFCSGSVTVRNNGPIDATDVSVAFEPPGAVITVANPRCSGDVCSLGTLARDAETTVSNLSWANSPSRPNASVRSAQNDFTNANNRVTM
ncbi:MAG TPA: hypothetical protein VHG90_02095 [Acidimicrobiales bacterium]|nr:hypothetical protein [Acidimicrobiales bacterium]